MTVPAIARWAIPLVFVLMALVPGINVALTGRDLLTIDNTGSPEPGGLALWLLRLSSFLVVGLSVVMIGRRASEAGPRRRSVGRLGVLGAFLIFFATNSVLPALVSLSDESTLRAAAYVALVFLAIGTTRDANIRGVLDAVRWSLLALLLASFAYAVLVPSGALGTFKPTLRLPYVPFRFWGLGSTPNSIGPLALVLVLVTIVHPSSWRIVDAAAIIAGGSVLVLAQSQTAWIAACLILPALIAYRRRLARGRDVRLALRPGAAVLAIGCGAALLVLGAGPAMTWLTGGMIEPTPGLNGSSEVLTGRNEIWSVALRTFLAHPMLGFGLDAWDKAFREGYGIPFASHAHNQVLHALSVGGLVGGAGLLVYIVVLVREGLRAARATGGLAPALLALVLLRAFSEVPLNITTLLVGETLMHALLFTLLVSAARYSEQAAEPTSIGARHTSGVRPKPAANAGELIA